MHADFTLQQAVGVESVDFEGRGFDARTFALEEISFDHLHAVAFDPAVVEAQQHLGPILAFGAARAGMDGHDRAGAVVLAGKKHAGFEHGEVRG